MNYIAEIVLIHLVFLSSISKMLNALFNGKPALLNAQAPKGKKVSMTINEMDLTTNYGACDHWLEIQYNLIGQTGPR